MLHRSRLPAWSILWLQAEEAEDPAETRTEPVAAAAAPEAYLQELNLSREEHPMP